MTAFFIVSAVGQALAGFLVDRLGAQRVLWAGIALFAVAGVVLGLAQSYAYLLLAAMLAGLGNCVFHPADFTVLNRHVSPKHLCHAFSAHGLSGNFGWAAAPVCMTLIAAWAGWRVAAFSAAGLALVVLVLLLSRRAAIADLDGAHEEKSKANYAEDTVASSLFGFLNVSAVWMCFAFFFVLAIAFGVFQSYAPAVLQNMYGLSLAAGASALTCYVLGSAGGIVLGGFLASKNEAHEKLIALVLFAAALFSIVLASGWIPAWSVLVVMAIIGFFSGIAGPSRDLLVRKAATARFGHKSYGRVYGFVYSGLDIGLAAAPLLFGWLMDASLFGLVLLGVAGMQCCALLMALKVGRKVSTSINHKEA